MKNLSIKILLSLIAIQCMGCGSEDLIDGNGTSPKILGKLKTVTNKTANTSLTFGYDLSNGVLSKLTYTGSDSTTLETFTRNETGQLTQSVVEVSAKGKKYSIKREYTYANTMLSAVKESVGDSKDLIVENFFYNETGLI